MKRQQVEELLRDAGRAAGRTEWVVIGSQSVHATTDIAPAEVLVSLECDVLLEEEDTAAEDIRREFGPRSAFHAERGFYLDVVPPRLPLLVDGWRDRLRPLDAGGVVGRCLDVHDLAVSKLGAGRLKDYEFVAALVAQRLIDLRVVQERIRGAGDLRLQAILIARMQIVMESLGTRK